VIKMMRDRGTGARLGWLRRREIVDMEEARIEVVEVGDGGS
jgi:hypothetical protein